ncbi:MAG: DMT family transporter, partial [Acidobacteriota bacterium]
RDLHSLTLTAPPMAMAAVTMGLLSWWLEADREVAMGLVPTLAVLYLAILGSAVTFTLYFWLLRYVDAVRVSLIAYGTPVVAVALGTLFLDEPLTVRMIFGASLVIGGMAFVTGQSRADDH